MDYCLKDQRDSRVLMTYYKKCSGIEVTDLNNKKYLDFSNMAVGSCILGYSNKLVNDFVKKY